MQKKSVFLKDLTTFRMGGRVTLVSLSSHTDVESFFYDENKYHIIGSGSNILVSEKEWDIPFVSYVDVNVLYTEINDSTTLVTVSAGKNWDEFVSETVALGYGTFANLSLIPGTVGAAPVQNIGAYGTEVSESIFCVKGYDTQEKKWKEYHNSDCFFSYRKSIFQGIKSFLITEVVFKLSKGVPKLPIYGALKKIFEEKESISPEELRTEVIRIRDSKLPRINVTASVGSFFKNPIVSRAVLEKLREQFETIPSFAVDEGKVKLAAGFLIEYSCSEIFEYKNLALYEKNRLVMVNLGDKTSLSEVIEYATLIKTQVKKKCGVEIEIEPEILREV